MLILQVGELIAVMAEDGEDWKAVAASSSPGAAPAAAPQPAAAAPPTGL